MGWPEAIVVHESGYFPRTWTHSTDKGKSIMGKGDKRTKKGKIYRGSYGKRRPRKLKGKAKTGASSPKRS